MIDILYRYNKIVYEKENTRRRKAQEDIIYS